MGEGSEKYRQNWTDKNWAKWRMLPENGGGVGSASASGVGVGSGLGEGKGGGRGDLAEESA